MNRVNYFTLLGLTPDASESDVRKAIDAKELDWNKTNVPQFERYNNEENRGLLPDIKTVMLEENTRALEASQWERENEARFNNDLAKRMGGVHQLLAVFKNTPGYLYESQVKRFCDLYGGLLEEGKLRLLIDESGLETRSDPADSGPNLDPGVVSEKTLAKHLEDIGKSDLYDFLGKKRNSSLEDLRQKASNMLDGYRNNGSQSGNNSKWKSVAQTAYAVFRSVEKRGKYDQALKARETKKIMDQILELAENIALINYRKLDRGHTEQLISMGQENGLDADEIVQAVVEHGVINGWIVTIEIAEDAVTINNLDDVIVCERGHINGKDRIICRDMNCMVQLRPFKTCICRRKVRPGANFCPTCAYQFLK